MSIWTKPLALAFVSVGFAVAGAIPNGALAQSTGTAVLLTGGNESIALAGARATAKLINIHPIDNPQAAPTQPRRIVNQLADFNEPASILETVVPQQAPDAVVEPPKKTLQAIPAATIPTTTTPLPSTPSTALPTVIVRPPAEGFFEGDGISVDVDRVDENSPNEFSVKLRVPHSVKIIEVTPIQNGSVSQSYKIRLTQKPDGRHVAAAVASLIEKTPGGLVANQVSAVDRQPVREPIGTRPGFQRNPFFSSQLPAPSLKMAELPQAASRLEAKTVRPPFAAPVIMPVARSTARESQAVMPAASVLSSENAALLNATPTEINFTEYAAPTLAEPASPAIPLTNAVPPIVSSSQATSAEQAFYKSTSGQTASHEMLEGVAFNSADSRWPKQVPLETKLVGPDAMGLNDVCEFHLELHNPGVNTEENLSIQITLPSGLEFLANENAPLSDSRTRSWHLPRLAAEETQQIQYQVKSTSEGSKTQKLWISSKGNAPQARHLDTVVDLQFETEDAPMLPFESKID
ncbi:MAG: hypothetical protein OSA89_06055 [Mariniblastus sp.]|nr:hypothetical protein [Mariniblastus sp.]